MQDNFDLEKKEKLKKWRKRLPDAVTRTNAEALEVIVSGAKRKARTRQFICATLTCVVCVLGGFVVNWIATYEDDVPGASSAVFGGNSTNATFA